MKIHTQLTGLGDDVIAFICNKIGLKAEEIVRFLGFAKLEIALAKGKQTHDKRNVLKDRDNKRDLARIKKSFNAHFDHERMSCEQIVTLCISNQSVQSLLLPESVLAAFTTSSF